MSKPWALISTNINLSTLNAADNYVKSFLPSLSSQGTIHESTQQAAEVLADSQQEAAQALIESEVVNFDETSLFENKKCHWLHSASTKFMTFCLIHDKRGKEGRDAAGIPPEFENIAVHGHWENYNASDCNHSFCNAHHLRELECASEQDNALWAGEMSNLLVLDIKEQADQAKLRGGAKLSQTQIGKFQEKHQTITQEALETCPPPPQKKQPGRTKQSKRQELARPTDSL